MPREETIAGLYSLPEAQREHLSEKRIAEVSHYACCHSNLRFGWDFVNHMVTTKGAVFPAFLHKDDLFLWRAYQYILGCDDPAVAGAFALTMEGNRTTRENLEALLISPRVTDAGIPAQQLGIPVATVIAYEKLFYNVLDRKKDHSYIMSIVYPHGRMIETTKEYVENTPSGVLMARAAYNHGPELALYMMGKHMRHPYKNMDAAQGAEEFDAMIMRDGILYAAFGLQNVDRAVPIENARKSIQAGKIGHGDQQEGASVLSLEDTLRTEIIQVSDMKARAAAAASIDAMDILNVSDLNTK